MAEPAKKVTRLKNIDADRVDGVDGPANGFPVLMMKVVGATGANSDLVEAVAGTAKAVNAQGGIDEKPDIAGAKGVLVDLFKLIQAEAAEGATGAFDEIHDICCLVEAVHAVGYFLACEQMGDEDDGEAMYKSVADSVLKRKFSAARRKELASEGKALDDGSYPIESEEDLHNAAVLARSGHGDVAAAKRLIARRAKELGVSNPLAAQKSADEPEAVVDEVVEKTADAPEASEGQPEEVSELVKEAIAKANEAHEAAIKELRDELAVLKATPVPGGPAITAPQAALNDQKLAKAAYYERQARLTENDRELSAEYARLAREARA